MATTFSSPSTSSSPPLSPDLSKDESPPFQITLDNPVIASPFPSPGSAFVPPPKPVVTEFTLPTKRGKKNPSSSAPGSGTATPNNNSIVQNNHNNNSGMPSMIDLESTALHNGVIPSSTADKARASNLSLSSTSTSTSTTQSQPSQPPSQPQTSSSTSVSRHNMPSASNIHIDSTLPKKDPVHAGNDSTPGSGRGTATTPNATTVSADGSSPQTSGQSSSTGNGSTTTTSTSTTNPHNSRASISASSTPSKRASLSSSRPAPPSPALSRNPSESRRQSRLSLGASPTNGGNNNNNNNNTAVTVNGTATPAKRLSTLSTLSATSNPNQNKRLSTLSNISTLPTVPQSQAAALITPTAAPASTSIPPGQILIRDFAYPLGDRRHTGAGADTPKVIKKMQKKYGPPGVRKPDRGRDSTSVSASSSCASSESGSRRGSGFGFSWGANAGGGFGGWWSGMWSGFGNGPRASRILNRGDDEDAYTPTANDLSMNFNTSLSSPDSSPAAAPQVISSHVNDGYDDNDDDEDDTGITNKSLLPGLYKAVFDFTPEGTAEMGLREGDIVRVAGEGGGVGWAVVVRGIVRFTEDGEEVIEAVDGSKIRTEDSWALVPESYLEVWRLDRNDGEDQYADDEE